MIKQHVIGIGDVLRAETAEEEEEQKIAIANRQRKWDFRFLEVARTVASWSKDPSTKVGAVLVRSIHNVILSTGYNGFPRAMPDENLHDRDHKYSCTIHAEVNALLNVGFAAALLKEPLTLYITPLPPCDRCAVQLLQAGVKRVVVGLGAANEETREQWIQSGNRGWCYLANAGVEMMHYSGGDF